MIDQMRPDYLVRYAGEMTGGLARLVREGVVFANADLGYAASLTAPGHATLATGSYPRTHGIVGNEWWGPGGRVATYCVGDPAALPVDGVGGGASPRHLLVPALGDWLKSASPGSKVISIAGKDRSAVLMGGLAPDLALWSPERSGRLVTSSVYAGHLPEWIKPIDSAGRPDPLDDSDPLVLTAALTAIVTERLGGRDAPDLLAIGLSATDAVGHASGTDGRAMHDHLLRLDRILGAFLAAVDKTLGKDRVILALSADHGAMPAPPRPEERPREVRRIRLDLVRPAVTALDARLRREWGVGSPLVALHDKASGFLDLEAAARAGVPAATLEREVRRGLLEIDGVEDVYFRRELLSPETGRRFLDRFRRGYYAPRGDDFELRWCESCLVMASAIGTTHGSPYPHDTRVPLVLWGAGLPPARIGRPVRTVDVAPTLARLLDVPIPAFVEGQALREALTLYRR